MDVLTTDTFDQSISTGVVIVDFFAEWCGPCHTLSPIIEELAEQFKDKLKAYKLDVDQAPPIAARFQVMSIPSVMFFKDGELKNTIVGAQPKSRYTDAINAILV